MAHKTGVVLLLLLVMIVLFLVNEDSSTPAVDSASNPIANGVSEQATAESETINGELRSSVDQTKKDNQLSPAQSNQLEKLLQEIESPEYSEDPYVELTLQSMDLNACEVYQYGILRGIKGKIKEQFLAGFQTRCDAKRKQRPHLLLNELRSASLKDVPATSHWGKRLKSMRTMTREEKLEATKDMMRHALQSQQTHWLVLSAHQNDGYRIFDFAEWLGTSDSYYHTVISYLAYSQLICEWDPNGLCGPHSNLMLSNCWYTPSDCGMPFDAWFEKNHMPGIKKDVALVVANLKSIGEGGDIE